MNKVLISNPFLFPPSGDNEEEKQLFEARTEIVKDYILYSLKEFEKTWQEEGEKVAETTKVGDHLFPDPIPTLTVSSADELIPSDMDFGEDNINILSNIHNFDFLNEFETPSFDLDKDFEKKTSAEETKKELLNTTSVFLNRLGEEESMFANNSIMTFHQEPFKQQQQQSQLNTPNHSEGGGQLVEGDWLSVAGFDILAITANDPDPSVGDVPAPSTVDTTAIQIQSSVFAEQKPDIKVEPLSTSVTSIRSGRQRRKSTQISRNVQDSSPMMLGEESMDLDRFPQAAVKTEPEQDVKPFALANLNGTASRSRSLSTTSTIVAPATPSSTSKSRKDNEQRRKRKYEFEDDNDPSVKNAKAAKLNREKKKQEMQKLQQENNQLKSDKKVVEDQRNAAYLEIEQKNQTIQRLEKLLSEEKCKNAENSCQRLKMSQHIENMVRIVSPNTVVISQRLGDLPAPTQNELEEYRHIMNENVMPAINEETYLTVKASNID